MSRLRSEIVERLEVRAQRLRELRDMTQDREERVRLDAQLDEIQITLSDLEHMDEPRLRQVLERHAQEHPGARGLDERG